jgi:hypothetical protein
MSDADEEPEEFVVLQLPESYTSEEVAEIADHVEEGLPDDHASLVIGDGIKTLSREELVNVLEDTVASVKGEHRLAGAEPAEQPADPPWEDEDEA